MPEGTAGTTDATHTGQLTFAPDITPTNGVATVWADTATAAAAKAFAGTITVTVAGQSTDYAFGPASVGANAADQKAFLAVATGSSVTLSFEDMAGQPGCDYDYNDRTWSGVTVATASDPIIARLDNQVWWAAQDPGAYATVTSVVSETVVDGKAAYKWWYEVTNTSVDWIDPDNNPNNYPPTGLAAVSIAGGTDQSTPLGFPENDLGWGNSQGSFGNGGYGDGAHWLSPYLGDNGDFLPVGGVGHFWYFTEPIPVITGVGEYFSPELAGGGGGPALIPGGLPRADIDIVGVLNAHLGVPEQFGETTEHTIGGLVVTNSNDNNAPRQQITVQALTNAAGQLVVGGKVEVTWAGGRVELYDAAAGGNKVPSGTLYDNVASVLPKQLWVQGVEGGPGERGSGTMRDVKIKAIPVGNVAGVDDVAFTVLWVDVTVVFSGTISADNDKRQDKKDVTSDANGNKTDALGINTSVTTNGTVIGWSLEGRGLVHPANFSYPGSDLRLRREYDYKAYIFRPGVVQPITGASNGFKNDSSSPTWLDNNPLDSSGFIYDLDSPGLVISALAQPHGTIGRFRANFRESAAVTINGINIRPSGIYAYYVRFSLVQNGPSATDTKWAVITSPDITGDKEASGPTPTNPGLTNLSADLS